MDLVPCQERDRIILAFALAVNQQNNANSTLEGVVDENERGQVLSSLEVTRGHCHELRDLLILHCQKHGC